MSGADARRSNLEQLKQEFAAAGDKLVVIDFFAECV